MERRDDATKELHSAHAQDWCLPGCRKLFIQATCLRITADFFQGDNKETVKAAEEALFKPKQQTLAELLRVDPLRHYDTSSVATSLPTMPAPPTTRKPPKPKSAAAFHVPIPWTCPTDGPLIKDAKGKGERRMFNWDAVYKNGEEWSFEEVRARERGLLGKEWRGEVKEWERGWHQAGCKLHPFKIARGER